MTFFCQVATLPDIWFCVLRNYEEYYDLSHKYTPK